ncbi:maleylpyruvate isomerase N-terminal domain-containing protein [Kitasatospora sp. NBC_01287]|uniref:maleylpyruvate isomerase N-terminal domain-containing protein n=1 Tax=Kitasatospora sp. NBC_01287 TaxID=2903573 RepID=UPI00225A6F81|nr:maleylpyruvate isomerase N-terminal domain-containing protein [Kitasatospora sp. NBC_01287]MCX4747275.1 maleylpyruvate isomerase N-terminal domain-containing protein [Kitasatospora sp. NBC_01287]
MLTEREHEALRGLLGAWALRACPPEEGAELERHFADCPDCAEEGERLRRAAARLRADDPLDQPDGLRQQVLDFCLTRRVADRPLAPWAAPYAAETAKLDALLRDLGPSEWQEVAELPWHGGALRHRPADVLCHLAAVDGLLARALGLPDVLPPAAEDRVPAQGGERGGPAGPFHELVERSERLSRAEAGATPHAVRTLWRTQAQALLREAAPATAGVPVDYGFATVPVRDAFIDRAFETWIHGEDVARAVDYPYAVPAPPHLRQMVDLAARMLPTALAGLRQAAYAGSAPAPGPGRTLRLVIEGPASGEWLIPLDGGPPDATAAAALAPPGDPVAEVVIDGVEFCQLAAAHRDPERLPVGEHGDRAAIRELLAAVPLLSRP